jgi:hypothetical protein
MGTIFLILGLAFVFSMIPVAFLVGRAYFKARGPRVIVCPETETTEVVAVDAARAAWAGVREEPDFRLVCCSRWPGRQDCGRDCLAQIESAPDGCLMRERLTRWYQGTTCAICGKPFGQIGWLDHKPGLVTLDREILGWEQVQPKELPEVLGTHFPLCWDCQVSETFRARFPERVVDDPRGPLSGRRTA